MLESLRPRVRPRVEGRGARTVPARAPPRVPLAPRSVATRYAVLPAPVQVAARAADNRARRGRALAADRAAHARAERGAAGGRADGARARLEVTPRGLAVEGVRARAARADCRTLLAADESADGRAARDDGGRARLTPEPRTLAASLRVRADGERRRENHEADQKSKNSAHPENSFHLSNPT